MKQLNTMKFMNEATRMFYTYIDRIDGIEINNAEDYAEAKAVANAALGFIDCMNVFGNAMICKENNDFTGDLGALTDQWHAEVCGALSNKAADTNSGVAPEKVIEILKTRDEYRQSADAQWE